MNTFLMILTWIANFHCATFGQASDSQCNNKAIFREDSRRKQCAKEVPHSNQASFYTNPLKPETQKNSPAFKQLSVSITNDGPASTLSSFLSQLNNGPAYFMHPPVPNDGSTYFMQLPVSIDSRAITTLSFLHLHIPINAT
jgi:hypothetical protein